MILLVYNQVNEKVNILTSNHRSNVRFDRNNNKKKNVKFTSELNEKLLFFVSNKL